MLDVWRAGDDIDAFESGWTFDHFYPIYSDSKGPCLEGWVTLAALAQATSRLRLGVLVTGIHYRHPAVLANMAATLDIVSEGRLELGIGAGWNEEESSAYGIALGTPRQRSDRFEEACQVLIGLLSHEHTTFLGEYFTLTDARCEPKGPQKPHVPICIGGNGERRTLRTTARFAQHWNFIGGTVDEFRRKLEVLREHCAAIGRDPKEILISSHIRPGPDGDPGPAVEMAAQMREAGLDLAIVTLQPPHRAAQLERIAKAFAELG
jgi:F420-dependent oxidoreductase-like protein